MVSKLDKSNNEEFYLCSKILFLDAQAKLWDGMLKGMLEAEKYGIKIPPKSIIKELPDEDKKPNNSVVVVKADSLKDKSSKVPNLL